MLVQRRREEAWEGDIESKPTEERKRTARNRNQDGKKNAARGEEKMVGLRSDRRDHRLSLAKVVSFVLLGSQSTVGCDRRPCGELMSFVGETFFLCLESAANN